MDERDGQCGLETMCVEGGKGKAENYGVVAMITLGSVAHVQAAIGQPLGPGEWKRVTQDQVNAFADVTGDYQWIHVDVERAVAGPFGTTIAHGYLTLSMIPMLIESIYKFEDLTMGVNYGLERVRFPAPVPVGSQLRAIATIVSADEGPQGLKVVIRVEVECDLALRPACVADTVALLVF